MDTGEFSVSHNCIHDELAAKGFAFPINGIIMGGMDWGAAMWSMCIANAACFVSLQVVQPSSRGLWMAWSAYYVAQGLSGFVRYKSRTGPWKKLKLMSSTMNDVTRD